MPDIKVSLIDYTGKGSNVEALRYAAALLSFTKNTRLQMSAGGLAAQISKSWSELEKELEYMANTIPSSWEFVDFTFVIENVTRAFTHQLVRTRTASYAQQTMRILDMSAGPGWSYRSGPTVSGHEHDKTEGADLRQAIYDETMEVIADAYKRLIEHGAAVEDARGILPTNILTNITMKINMRNWIEMVRKRSSIRTQDEYRQVLDAMVQQVRAVYPWIGLFLDRDIDKVIKELEAFVVRHKGRLVNEEYIGAVKLLDQLRAMK